MPDFKLYDPSKLQNQNSGTQSLDPKLLQMMEGMDHTQANRKLGKLSESQ